MIKSSVSSLQPKWVAFPSGSLTPAQQYSRVRTYKTAPNFGVYRSAIRYVTQKTKKIESCNVCCPI